MSMRSGSKNSASFFQVARLRGFSPIQKVAFMRAPAAIEQFQAPSPAAAGIHQRIPLVRNQDMRRLSPAEVLLHLAGEMMTFTTALVTPAAASRSST